MTTPAKAAANAQNARCATRPRTEKCQKLAVPPDQQAEFEELHQALQQEIAPEGALEQITFHQLVHAAWKARSIARLEEELLLGGLEAIQDEQAAQTLDRLQRYAAAADRAYYRALKELRILQTARGVRQTIPDETAEAIPILASIPIMTKQVHDLDRNANVKVEKMIDAIENTPMPSVA